MAQNIQKQKNVIYFRLQCVRYPKLHKCFIYEFEVFVQMDQKSFGHLMTVETNKTKKVILVKAPLNIDLEIFWSFWFLDTFTFGQFLNYFMQGKWFKSVTTQAQLCGM